MSNNSSQVHHTITNRTKNSWVFVCPTCGYKARYNTESRQNEPQLEILQIGDPQARHASNHAQVSITDDEAWLTPKLRQQMEELLKDVDMGDW
jgi:hypothetical protein